jgi:uncharacterized membrane protein YfcA
MEIEQYILIFLVSTFAGTYALMFGGGSLLTLPTLFLLGVDPRIAIASNQLGAIGQLIAGSWVFIKNKKINPEVIKWVAPAFLVGTLIGANVLIRIEGELIVKMVSVAILIFATLMLFKNPEQIPIEKVIPQKKILGLFLTVLLGIYAMVITASTGTMFIFILTYLFGLKFKRAIENRPHIAIIGVLVAVIFLWFKGFVDVLVAIPIFLGRGFGAYISANIVLKTHGHVLRIIFSIVIILMALKMLFF